MPIKYGSDRIGTGLFYEQTKEDGPDTIDVILGPLRYGKPVLMTVSDRKMFSKSRLKGPPILSIVPLSFFGGRRDVLMVSLQTHGCEVIDVTKDLKSISFYRLGINTRLSKALCDALKRVFNIQ